MKKKAFFGFKDESETAVFGSPNGTLSARNVRGVPKGILEMACA